MPCFTQPLPDWSHPSLPCITWGITSLYSPLASLASAADMGMSSPSVFPTAPSSSEASSLSSSFSLTPRPPGASSPGSSPETPSYVKTVLEASWLSMLRRRKNEGKMSLNTYFELGYLNCIGSIRRYFILSLLNGKFRKYFQTFMLVMSIICNEIHSKQNEKFPR